MDIKKILATSLLSSTLLISTMALGEASTIANPYVAYPSFEAMAQSMHYVPLYLTRSSGFEPSGQTAINGNVAELSYKGIKNPESTITIRTMQAEHVGAQMLSGHYSNKWEAEGYDGTVISTLSRGQEQVAYWSVNGWSFAVTAKNMSKKAFHQMIIDNLYDMSVHSFLNFKAR